MTSFVDAPVSTQPPSAEVRALLADFAKAGPQSGEKRYEWLTRAIRTAVHDASLPDAAMLPTEAELGAEFAVSRQTVRHALEQLSRDGLLVRLAGRGTFIAPRAERPKQFSTSQDLLSAAADAEFELVVPLHKRIDLAAAGRLQLRSDVVSAASFRRIHDGTAYGFTSVFLPPEFGDLLSDVDELLVKGSSAHVTIVDLLDERVAGGIVGADESITATGLPVDAANYLGRTEGDLALQIDIAFSDSEGRIVELQSSYFLPQSYSYRSHFVRTR